MEIDILLFYVDLHENNAQLNYFEVFSAGVMILLELLGLEYSINILKIHIIRYNCTPLSAPKCMSCNQKFYVNYGIWQNNEN